jgi:hypothetical protein
MKSGEFYVVGMTHAEAGDSDAVMKAIQDSVRMPMFAGMNPVVLMADQTSSQGPIPGFEQFWIVFFLNSVAWQACAHLQLKKIRLVSESELPPRTGTLNG